MRGYKINKSSVLGLAKSMYYITMLSQRWCLCGLVWFLPLPCSKIWNCAQDDIKFLVHSAVISNTVYLMQLLMIKELTRISMMNVEHGN